MMCDRIRVGTQMPVMDAIFFRSWLTQPGIACRHSELRVQT